MNESNRISTEYSNYSLLELLESTPYFGALRCAPHNAARQLPILHNLAGGCRATEHRVDVCSAVSGSAFCK